ncbi:MAG: BMP family ABC transporter substrate-binding protein [Firmicutes bacterium]|nr:BMP family ABC transporter substrate-binding protein [Bacillota bacterium]
MKKKLIIIALILALAFSMFACAKKDEPKQEEGQAGTDDAKIAVVTDVGQLMDKGFNQGTYEGAKAYADANGISMKYYQPANGSDATDNDRIDAMKQAIENGAEVIVTPGFLQATALEAVAKEYPDVKFVFVDGWAMGFQNITAIVYKEQESGYLAGYAAVKEGYTKLGFTGGGGGGNPAVNRFGYGFVQGAEAAAKELGVDVEIKYSYKYGETFSASTELQTQIAGWYADGTEVVFSCGGSMFQSVLSAAAEYEDAKIIGVDVDQSGESSKVITSAVKGLSASVEQVLGQFYDGKWDAELADKAQNLGAAENATGLPEDTWSMKNFTVDQYKELLAKVAKGEVTPDATVPENANNGDWLNGFEKVKVIFE